MKTRIVHTKVWKDSWFVNLSLEAKTLWLYLITNDQINISGIYELTEREIEFDTGIKLTDKVRKELKPKALFYENWVFIPNVDKFNNYKKAPNNQIAFEREVQVIPQGVIDTILADTSIHTSIYTHPILQEIRNKKQGTENKEQELINNKQEEDELPFGWRGDEIRKTRDLIKGYNK